MYVCMYVYVGICVCVCVYLSLDMLILRVLCTTTIVVQTSLHYDGRSTALRSVLRPALRCAGPV